jgi:hypothetical protein
MADRVDPKARVSVGGHRGRGRASRDRALDRTLRRHGSRRTPKTGGVSVDSLIRICPDMWIVGIRPEIVLAWSGAGADDSPVASQ